MTKQRCFGIAGWKNSGKTSLVSALVNIMTARGLNISTLKHAHHAFDLDQPHTDSFKHREAGASETVLVSANRWAIQHELHGAAEPSFEEIVDRISPCDLLLVEGYKREPIPKIEIIGPENTGDFLWPDDPNVKALASDQAIHGCDLPRFERSQAPEVADFILNFYGMKP